MYDIPDGVWPTMITPYTEDNKIDYNCLEELIEWYVRKGWTVCFQVSQVKCFSSLEERVELARFVKKANGRIPALLPAYFRINERSI